MLAAYRHFLQTAAGRLQVARFGYPAILMLAGLLRFWNLANPHALVFDETYYVKDAYTLSQAGVELAWPKNPDPRFVAGSINSFTNQPAFVVHPPLGKWLIAVGMNLFGATSSFGWRFSAALFGTLLVGLTMLVARQLFRSITWSLVAGFFMAIDGHAIVLSRTSLLDGFLAFFALLSFYLLLRDREITRIKMLQDSGVRIYWNRPWLMACAMALGAATAVKWSGLWFALGFGLYVCASEGLFRRRLVDDSIGKSTRQALVNFVLMAPLFLATYISSWSGWLMSDQGYDAKWGENASNLDRGVFFWVPAKLQALWHYHQEAYGFHVGLHTPHSYASNPVTWLFLIRPTSFYYEGANQGEPGCDFASGCASATTALGNPLIWYSAVFALVWLVIRYFKTRESAPGLILLGIATGYLPWLLYMNRTVFQFYSIAFLPWLVLALVFGLRSWIRNKSKLTRPKYERYLVGYLALVLLLSIYFYPIWAAIKVPYLFWYSHMWIPSWI